MKRHYLNEQQLIPEVQRERHKHWQEPLLRRAGVWVARHTCGGVGEGVGQGGGVRQGPLRRGCGMGEGLALFLTQTPHPRT